MNKKSLAKKSGHTRRSPMGAIILTFVSDINILRAYPNNRVVMRPSEKFEAKTAGQKCSEAWFSPR